MEAGDFPGFLANRILMPMINEAIFALMEGVGTVEGHRHGHAPWHEHPMGPLALADLIGLDVCLAVLRVLHEGWAIRSTARHPSWSGWWTPVISGRKTGRRILHVRIMIRGSAVLHGKAWSVGAEARSAVLTTRRVWWASREEDG